MSSRWSDTLRSPTAIVLFAGTATVGLAADLLTKAAAVATLKDGNIVRFIPGLIQFTYTENHGAVFGLGQGQQALFLTVSVAAIGFLFFLFLTSGRSRPYQLILGMLLAGVLGNMYDRMVYGYVRDMIYALPGWHWPGSQAEVFPWIFNVADVLLCVGVGLIFIHSFFAKPKEKEKPAEVEQPVR